MALDPTCAVGEAFVQQCLDGTNALNPVWARTQQPDGSWSEWTALTWYQCPGDEALFAAIEREWSQLQPAPSVINLQPGNGWVIATVPTIAMADDAPRTHSTTLLGASVEIRATPSGYVWDWGDGERTTTTDPGRPYPNATVTHTYPHASGGARVALTTTWTGEYRVNGGAWVNFDSTIESAASPVMLAVHDPRSRLVDCDVTDSCRLIASG